MGAAQDPADQPRRQRGHTAAGAQQQKGKNGTAHGYSSL